MRFPVKRWGKRIGKITCGVIIERLVTSGVINDIVKRLVYHNRDVSDTTVEWFVMISVPCKKVSGLIVDKVVKEVRAVIVERRVHSK